MVSPFAAWEDEKRRRRRIALGLESDARPQMARRGLSREELIALADAEAEAEAQRIAPLSPAPGVDPGRAFEAFTGAIFPESMLLAAAGGAVGERFLGEPGRRFGEFAGFTAGPGALIRGPKAAVKLAALSGAGAAVGGEIAGPTGEIVGGVAAPLSPTGVRLAVRGGTAAVRGGARLAEEVGRTNAGNALLPPAPQAVAAGAKGRIIPVVTRATEADRARIQAFIDGFVPADRTGSVTLGDLVPAGADPLDIQQIGVNLRLADQLGIRATSEGRPLSFLLASRPGQITAAQYRKGAAITTDFGGPGQGRQTYMGLTVGAKPAATIAQATAPPLAPAAQAVAPPPAVAPAPPTQPPIPPAAPPRVPPAVPPVPPSQPTLIPPGSPGVNETLSQARAIVQRDRPGIVTRIADLIPGVKQAVHRAQPRLDQPEGMTAGWVGEGLAQGKVDTALQQTRIGHLAQLDAAFGKGATGTRDFKPAGVAFKGTAEQARYPYVGTLADIMARPSLYNLSPTQKAVLGAIQAERSAAFNGVKSSYGLDIGEFPVEPGGVHLPNVDIEESALAMAGGERGALLRGRTKARVYANAADRWAHDPEFRPETTVSSLLAANDMTLAYGSGHRVLTEGLGGKTRLQVIQETHPQLAAKMDILQKRLASVRATASRIGGKQAEAIDNFAQSPLDPTDLATLQADLNPMVGADAVGRKGPNFGKDFAALKEEVAQAKAAIAALRPAWEVANLKPYVFVQEGIYRYFPVKEADQVKDLLKKSQNPIVRFIDNVRATAFGGDLSPISIQGATSWLSDPIGTSRFVAQGKGGLTQAGMLADMKANPESWQRFTAATGINPLGGVDLEFATGFIGKIPKVGKGWANWNEALYRPITRLQKDAFENSYQAAVKHGLSPEQAMAVAGDDATKIIPRSNYRRLGQSQADAAHYRAALTSVSFLTQPAALMNDAVKGLVKIGTKQTITQSERFAVKRVLTLVATVEAIAIMSNTYHAQTHGLDVEQAVKDSLNPNSGKFMSLVLPNGARVGLGGPFRGIIRAVAPREVKGVPVPIPFGGIYQFARGKIGPAPRIVYDLARNKDYYGRKIWTEDFPVNILQGLEYALEGVAPLTVGGAAAKVREGATAGEVGQEVASQFMGTNYLPDDPAYAASVRWQNEFEEYRSLPTNAREATSKRLPTRDAYRKRNPQIEAKMFIAGDISSLSSGAAKVHALTLMRQNNIKSADIKSLAPRDFDSPPHIALRRYFAQQLGESFVSGKTR